MAASAFLLAIPSQADVTAKGSENFQRLFAEHGFTLANPPKYEDLKALGWSQMRIEHADLLVDNPIAANAYADLFSEQLSALGFSIDEPPSYTDLMSLNFSDDEISVLAVRFEEILDGEEKKGLIQCDCGQLMLEAYRQTNCRSGIGTYPETIIRSMCNSGYIVEWKKVSSIFRPCIPCSALGGDSHEQSR